MKQDVSRKIILIVEDEQELVKAVEIRLKHAGYEVLIAGNGKEGLEKIRAKTPDLVLLDAMMPEMDGYQMCKVLKSSPQYNKIPVIMLTAKAQAEDRRLGAQMGADSYIAKPFDHKVLLDKIRELTDV